MSKPKIHTMQYKPRSLGASISGVTSVKFIRISELPIEEQEPFKKWMRGQTCPLIEGIDMQDTVYPHDYDRWKATLRGEFVPWD